MRIFARAYAPALVCVFAAFAVAKVGGVLHFSPKQGAVLKYNVNVRMTIQSAKVVISGVSTHTVTSVDSKGFVSSKSTDSNSKVTVNGSTVKNPPPTSDLSTSVNRPNGTVASVGGSDTSATRWRRETVQTVELPNVPLAIGTAWTWLSKANPKTGAVKAKGQYKVLGSEVISGTPTWRISVNVKELTGAAPASMTGTEWINKLDGTPVRCRLKEKNIPVQGIPPQTVVSISVDLIR